MDTMENLITFTLAICVEIWSTYMITSNSLYLAMILFNGSSMDI
jgi:hypothetical protein